VPTLRADTRGLREPPTSASVIVPSRPVIGSTDCRAEGAVAKSPHELLAVGPASPPRACRPAVLWAIINEGATELRWQLIIWVGLGSHLGRQCCHGCGSLLIEPVTRGSSFPATGDAGRVSFCWLSTAAGASQVAILWPQPWSTAFRLGGIGALSLFFDFRCREAYAAPAASCSARTMRATISGILTVGHHWSICAALVGSPSEYMISLQRTRDGS
jgi:hypothetical protein